MKSSMWRSCFGQRTPGWRGAGCSRPAAGSRHPRSGAIASRSWRLRNPVGRAEQSEAALYRALGNALDTPQGARSSSVDGGARASAAAHGLMHRRHLVVVIGSGVDRGRSSSCRPSMPAVREATSATCRAGLRCDAEAPVATAALLKPSVAGENHSRSRRARAYFQGGRPGNSVELMLLLVGEREWYQWVSAWHGSLTIP